MPFQFERENSLVWEPGRWVLWWHAKAACTSLKSWYLDLCRFRVARNALGQWGVGQSSVHNFVGPRGSHFDPDRHRNYFHWTVVRHPLARIVSHWDQQGVDKLGSLAEYVRELVVLGPDGQDIHVMPQVLGLWGLSMHAVLRLEEIGEAWPRMMRFLGLPDDPLPVRTARGAGAMWRTRFADPLVRDVAERYYAADLAEFYPDEPPIEISAGAD